jgi:hypothetical protein
MSVPDLRGQQVWSASDNARYQMLGQRYDVPGRSGNATRLTYALQRRSNDGLLNVRRLCLFVTDPPTP